MLNIEKIYPKDIIAIVVLVFSLVLISMGINHLVSGIVIMIITFYFTRRIGCEGEPSKVINNKIQKLETKIKHIPKPPEYNTQTTPIPSIKPESQATGDFKVLPNP